MKEKDNHYLISAARAAVYLCLQQTPSGKFIYERGDADMKIIPGSYNMLRHAGCVWVASKILSPTVTKAARDYLLDRVISREGISLLNCNMNRKQPPVYKLGGQALTILACADYIEKAPLWSLRSGLYTFLYKTMKPKHFKRVEGRVTPFKSDYYTGEALMALCHINEINAAIKMIAFTKPANHDHWYLMALGNLGLKIPKLAEDYMEKGKRIALQIIQEPEVYEGHACRIACRLEGMISWHKLYKSWYTTAYKAGQTDPIDKRFEEWITHYIHVLLKYQNKDGAFIANNTYRIDYTQHAAHALYLYDQS